VGYYRFSLRERERPIVFHLSWVGFAGGGLIQSLERFGVERVFHQVVKSCLTQIVGRVSLQSVSQLQNAPAKAGAFWFLLN
jgi:hypothetical protein